MLLNSNRNSHILLQRKNLLNDAFLLQKRSCTLKQQLLEHFPSDSGTTEPNLFEFLFIHQSEETFKSEKQNGSNGAFLENICFVIKLIYEGIYER